MAQKSQATESPFIGIMGIQGRNGSDNSLMIPEGQCLEAMNVNWFRCSLGGKRGGCTTIGLTGGTAFTDGARSGYRHVPGDNQGAAEFWTIDGALKFHRLAGGSTWADPTVLDPCTALPQEVNWQSFNGNLYVAYKSAHNRLHLWDGLTLRRVGLDLPAAIAAPTKTAGAIVADTRKYRIAWTRQVSGITIGRSNLSVASASVTYANEQGTATRGTPPGEGETHWELYGAATATAFGDYRRIATTAIATTTAVDNSPILDGAVAPEDGANTPPPSAKYMVADDSRIVMGGAYELAANAENAMAPSPFRVWWTSLLGSSNLEAGDGERISNTGTINGFADLEEAIVGISQPMQVTSAAATSLERGSFYVFSFGSQWKFISTNDVNTAYVKFRVTGGGGSIHHKSIINAEDVNGNPAIYWASSRGIMRISTGGQEYLGEDVVDVWETINLDALIPCHAIFYSDVHQVIFYIATGTSQFPNEAIVFDTRLGRVTEASGVRFGWSRYQGDSTHAYFSVMFSESIGSSMGRKLKPHVGYVDSTAIFRCDTDDLDDAGMPFQAFIDSKSYVPWGLHRQGGTKDDAMVVADPAEDTVIYLTVYRNEGAEASRPSPVDLGDPSDSGQATLVFPKAEGSALGDSQTYRCRIGDLQASSTAWRLHAVIVPMFQQGSV